MVRIATAGLAGLLVVGTAIAAEPGGDPRGWAFAFTPDAARRMAPVLPDRKTVLGVPGSPIHATFPLINDTRAVLDWFPASHPAPPMVVMRGPAGPRYRACGFCHLPDGNGRPENASLAGLPADYIAAQVAHFRDGTRKAPLAHEPSELMAEVSREVGDDEVREAAAYFSALPRRSHVRVAERATIPRVVVMGSIWRIDPRGGSEPIAARVIEVPDDVARFVLRDPNVTYTAFAPPGSVARGHRLGTALACGSCHGARLEGGIAPTLAGRSPSYIGRQLYAFRDGSRRAQGDEAMRAVAAGLKDGDVVALAAWAASRRAR